MRPVKNLRECPNCGYRDPPYWRHVRYRLFTDCCRLEEFTHLQPELAKRIVKEINIIKAPYIYHLVKRAGIVQRIHISDSYNGKSWREPETERLKRHKYADPRQKKLTS